MSFQLEGKVVFFATSNINKFHEARKVLAEYNIATGMLRVKTHEIQSENIEEIAKVSAMEAFRSTNLPIIVEDAGLFVEALNGFPGPYTAYVYKVIGNKGLLKLMENVENRRAKFQSVIAYCAPEAAEVSCFMGEVEGMITMEERRVNAGFGFDPIFEPFDSGGKAFSEMTVEEKSKYSHRAKALRKFAIWYRENTVQK